MLSSHAFPTCLERRSTAQAETGCRGTFAGESHGSSLRGLLSHEPLWLEVYRDDANRSSSYSSLESCSCRSGAVSVFENSRRGLKQLVAKYVPQLRLSIPNVAPRSKMPRTRRGYAACGRFNVYILGILECFGTLMAVRPLLEAAVCGVASLRASWAAQLSFDFGLRSEDPKPPSCCREPLHFVLDSRYQKAIQDSEGFPG